MMAKGKLHGNEFARKKEFVKPDSYTFEIPIGTRPPVMPGFYIKATPTKTAVKVTLWRK